MLDFFSPPICPYCKGDLFEGEGHLCASCEEQLPIFPERICPSCGGPNSGYLDLCNDCLAVEGGRPWTYTAAAFPYTGILRVMIHKFKYRNCTEMAPFLAQRMYERWNLFHGDYSIDGITYIPLHFTRYLMRGYNQAELLAGMVAKKMQLPLLCTLRRCHRTATQMRLDFKHRMSNMSHAFAPVDAKGRIAGKRLLLIDDVFTTGATLSAATRVLLRAGASDVCVLCAGKA